MTHFSVDLNIKLKMNKTDEDLPDEPCHCYGCIHQHCTFSGYGGIAPDHDQDTLRDPLVWLEFKDGKATLETTSPFIAAHMLGFFKTLIESGTLTLS
jgi:hypothetical protein